MEQLAGLDAGFLNMETPTVHGHVGGLALFDVNETPMTLEMVKGLVTERLHELGPFRRRLVPVPFGIDRPYWVEDGDFDIDFHVRHIAVPPPGSHRQLADLVARLHSRPLDRTRPLWELYLIEGLEGGLVAHYTKIHHACVDGVTGTEVLTTLLDTDPEGRSAERQIVPWSPDRMPNSLEMLTRGIAALATQPRVQLRLQRRLLSAGLLTGRRQVAPTVATIQEALRRTPGLAGLVPEPSLQDDFLSRPALAAPRLSFNRSISAHRRFAFGSVSLEDVKDIKHRYASAVPEGRVTVNDVIMAISAGALRSWLQQRHELPTDPVLAMVPVSVRTDGDGGTGTGDWVGGNRISAMIAPLPTNEADPLKRLGLAHAAMSMAKTDHAALPADMLQDFGRFAPPAVAARVARLVARTKLADMTNPPFNLVISNIPGPQHPLYCAGARQVASFPVPVVSDGAGLNITLSSYDGGVHFGLLACRESVEDLWSLLEALQESTDQLHRATGEKPAPRKSAAPRSRPEKALGNHQPSGRS